MVGVSSPLFRGPGALKFHTGFAAGMLTSALFLSLMLVPISLTLQDVPLRFRAIVLAILAAGFAALDLLDRTPQAWRQVPQRFGLRGLSFGPLGFVYGADVGLYVTTQKTTSLLWVAILGSVLLGPASAVAATLIVAATVHSSAIALLSALDQRTITDLRFWGWSARTWTRTARLLAAIILLGTSWLTATSLV